MFQLHLFDMNGKNHKYLFGFLRDIFFSITNLSFNLLLRFHTVATDRFLPAMGRIDCHVEHNNLVESNQFCKMPLMINSPHIQAFYTLTSTLLFNTFLFFLHFPSSFFIFPIIKYNRVIEGDIRLSICRPSFLKILNL